MRILYTVPRYWPSVGGAQILSRELIKRIAARHAVQVVTQSTSDRDSFIYSVTNVLPGHYQDGDIRVNQVGPEGPWRTGLQMLGRVYGHFRPLNLVFSVLLDRVVGRQLEAIVHRFQPQVLHAVHIGLVYSSESAYRIARRCRVPFVWTPFTHIESTGWQGRRFRRLYRKSDAIVAMTNREREWLIEHGAKPPRVQVIPVGPLVHSEHNAEGFRVTYDLGRFPVVLFLGQKLQYKGYQQMVEAAPRVWESFPETRFVFVGPRTEESELFFSSSSDFRIVEVGIVDLYEKTSALAACDILCVPSTQESLGGVYLEAWSLGKPVVAANIHITQEVIDDGQDGLLVDQTPIAIAEAIVNLLGKPDRMRSMGERGFQKVRDRYEWFSIASETEKLYKSLAEQVEGG